MNTIDSIALDNIVPSLGPMATSNEIGDGLVHFFTFRVAASDTCESVNLENGTAMGCGTYYSLYRNLVYLCQRNVSFSKCYVKYISRMTCKAPMLRKSARVSKEKAASQDLTLQNGPDCRIIVGSSGEHHAK